MTDTITSPARSGPDYSWPGGQTARRLFRAQPGAFLLRRGPGRRAGAGRAAARRAELCLARLRQPRRRLVHARRLRRAGAADGGAGQQRHVRLRAAAGCRPPQRAATRSSGHGRTNAERQGTLDEAAEAALIGEATARLTKEEGVPPEGWLGPWISPQPRHARPAGGGRLQLPAGLVHGRPAGLVPMPRRAGASSPCPIRRSRTTFPPSSRARTSALATSPT